MYILCVLCYVTILLLVLLLLFYLPLHCYRFVMATEVFNEVSPDLRDVFNAMAPEGAVYSQPNMG